MPRKAQIVRLFLASVIATGCFAGAAAAASVNPKAPLDTKEPTNDAPNRYMTAEHWARLPDGRKMGSTSAVTFRNENVAILAYDDIIGLIATFGLSRAAGFADRHQELSIGAKFEHLVTDRGSRRRIHAPWSKCAASCTAASCQRWRVILVVRHPDVIVFIHINAMRSDEHPAAKAFQHVAVGVKLEDQVHLLDLAGLGVQTAISATALCDPH